MGGGPPLVVWVDMFLAEAMASVFVETSDPQSCGVEIGNSTEDLLRGFLFRVVVSLSPGRYRKQNSSGMERRSASPPSGTTAADR